MKIIENIEELRRVIDEGANPWRSSAQFKKMMYWNTTGREFVPDFPTIYAPTKLIKILRKQYHF